MFGVLCGGFFFSSLDLLNCSETNLKWAVSLKMSPGFGKGEDVTKPLQEFSSKFHFGAL